MNCLLHKLVWGKNMLRNNVWVGPPRNCVCLLFLFLTEPHNFSSSRDSLFWRAQEEQLDLELFVGSSPKTLHTYPAAL